MPTIIISIISGLVVAVLVAFTVKNETLNDYSIEKNKNGYYIMRLRTRNKIVVGFSFSFSIIAFIFATYYAVISDYRSIMIYLLGLFFTVLGIIIILLNINDRIEYNDEEIKQYRIFRKHPQTIRWDDLNNIIYHKIGPSIELNNLNHRIFVDFRNNGIMNLLNFIKDKDNIKSENKKIVTELLNVKIK